MNAFRVALAELRRLTSNRLATLGVIALTVIPTLYGGLYLWANHDPYAALPQVPAAVVTDDAGTTLRTGERLQVGEQVAQDLVDSKSFDWHHVTRQEALDGVESGRFSFAVLVPKTFSADLASSGDFTPRQAKIELETNDANNYLTTLMGNTVIKEVTTSVAAQVSQTAAGQLLGGISEIHGQLDRAVGGADRLRVGIVKADTGEGQAVTGANSLATGLKDLDQGVTQLRSGTTDAVKGADALKSGATTLATGLDTLQTKTAGLPAQTKQLAGGAQQVADGNAKIAGIGKELAGVSTTLRSDLAGQRADLIKELRSSGLDDAQIAIVETRLDRIDGLTSDADDRIQQASKDLTVLSTGATQVAAGAKTLAAATPALTSGIGTAASGARQVRDGAVALDTGLRTLDSGAAKLETASDQAATGAASLAIGAGQLKSGLDELAQGATTLKSELAKGLDSVPNPTEAKRKAVAQTLGAPVGVSSGSVSSAGSYGAGLAPLFLSLALWIGAYVLFLLVRPFSTRALATSQRSVRTALGGWLAPVAIGIAQTALLYLVITLALGIKVVHPVLALLFLGFVSLTFVAILHALAARFGAIGKFLGLVFMVIQLVSAGGTFPWQTLPGPLQAVHQVVPMSYAIDGLRRLMYGASLGPVLGDLAVLAGFLVAALALSTYAARRSRVWTPARIKPELAL